MHVLSLTANNGIVLIAGPALEPGVGRKLETSTTTTYEYKGPIVSSMAASVPGSLVEVPLPVPTLSSFDRAPGLIHSFPSRRDAAVQRCGAGPGRVRGCCPRCFQPPA